MSFKVQNNTDSMIEVFLGDEFGRTICSIFIDRVTHQNINFTDCAPEIKMISINPIQYKIKEKE